MRQRVYLDTDLGNDIDDVIALSMLQQLHSSQYIDLIGISSSNANRKSLEFIKLFNLHYGNNVPIGAVEKGVKNNREKYLHLLPLLKEHYPEYSKDLTSYDCEMIPSNVLMKSVLQSSPDNSIILLMIGFATNIANFLYNESNYELAHRKINKIVCMAGHFPYGPPEYNIKSDANSFQSLLQIWKKEIDFIGFESGININFLNADLRILENYQFLYPLTLSYRSYKKGNYLQPCWDPLSVLHCIYPNSDYYSLSARGGLILNDDLSTTFLHSEFGLHRYLFVNPNSSSQIKKSIVDILTTNLIQNR